MKILVTGGTGLVGRAIESIKDKYSEHSFIFSSSRDCDLINYLDTYRYFSKIKPDYIIHLAAIVGGLFKNMNYKVIERDNETFFRYLPPKKIKRIFNKKDMACKVQKTGFTGFYFRVLEEGMVQPKTPLKLLEKGSQEITIEEANDLMFRKEKRDYDRIEIALSLDFLSESCNEQETLDIIKKNFVCNVKPFHNIFILKPYPFGKSCLRRPYSPKLCKVSPIKIITKHFRRLYRVG